MEKSLMVVLAVVIAVIIIFLLSQTSENFYGIPGRNSLRDDKFFGATYEDKVYHLSTGGHIMKTA